VNKDKRAGLWLTVSFHLSVLIGFLLYSINSQLKSETSFVLDFTKQEEQEKEEKTAAMKESVSKELDDLIAAAKKQAPRNAAVDVSKGRNLKDDRHSNPNSVYNDAKELQKKLDASRKALESEGEDEENVATGKEDQQDKPTKEYTGPSVLSYRLDGRKAIKLPIPAYRCIGGGDVAVAIVVDRKGVVIDASVIDETSVSDDCQREYAVKAAKLSRFTASKTAPEKQAGEILYRFVAQ